MTSAPGASTRRAVSADGTRIAYEVTGAGPVLVVGEGALCHRGIGAFEELAPILSDRFSVVGYDRRGRGESDAGASPYAVQREVEDLVAVLEAAGSTAFVFGMSSGAALALEAARQRVGMERLAVYEAPFLLDDSHPPDDPGFTETLRAHVARGRPRRAVQAFMRLMGVPRAVVAVLPLLPVGRRLIASGDTLPHDFEIVSPYRRGEPLPDGHYASIATPTLAIAGSTSPTFMRTAAAAIAAQIPGAATETLEGQGHDVAAEAIAPVLSAHFLRSGTSLP